MASSGVIRRTAQRLASVDWSAPVFKGDQELSVMVAGFRAWTAKAETMAEKYSSPPTPIDFTTAKKSVRDVALVENLEKLYSSSSPSPLTYEWSAEDQAAKKQLIEDAKAGLAFTQEMIEDCEREIAFLKVNKVDRETSVSDLKEVYPDIAEEVETEIEKREWFKDTLK